MSKLTTTKSELPSFRDYLNRETLDELFIVHESGETIRLNEGKWIKTSSKNKIRVDHPTHGVGQTHAHIYGRKGNEMGVINIDGTPSHGTSMTVSKQDAKTLRSNGFTIPTNRIVEWFVLGADDFQLLLG